MFGQLCSYTFLFFCQSTPKNFYPSFITLCLDAFVVRGENIYVMPKVKFHVFSKSYKQLTTTEWDRSSSSLFSLLLLLVLAMQFHAESAAVKLFTEATLSLSWKKNKIAFFWVYLLLDFWMVSIPRNSQQASELVVGMQGSVSRSDVGAVGLPCFSSGREMLDLLSCPVLVLHQDGVTHHLSHSNSPCGTSQPDSRMKGGVLT